MIYFSEVKGKKIVTEDGVLVGKLKDLIFIVVNLPAVTKLCIENPKKETLIISIDFLKKITNTIIIKKNYQTTILEDNELFVNKNLLDEQIIDLKGNKIVKVNDVAIQDKPNFYIAGVDIGLLGIIRWFGLESLYNKIRSYLPINFSSQFLSWGDIQPLELARGKVKLNVKQEKLTSLHPADLADYLERTNLKNITQIVSLIDKNYATRVIAEMNPNFQIALLKRLGLEKTEKIISLMDPDEAVDVLTQFPEEKRAQILEHLEPSKKKEIEHLLKFSGTSIGPYLNSEFITCKVGVTAGYVINQIRKEATDITNLFYVYVTNDNEQLVGVFNLHELIIQPVDTPIYKFMIQNVIVIHLNSPINTVIRKMAKYHLYELPVVDKDKKIIGLVNMDDIGEYYLEKIGT